MYMIVYYSVSFIIITLIVPNHEYKRYEDRIIAKGDLVYHQAQNWKALQGLVKVFAMKMNSIWIFAHRDTRKVPKYNVKRSRKKEDVNKNEKVSEKDGKVGVKF